MRESSKNKRQHRLDLREMDLRLISSTVLFFLSLSLSLDNRVCLSGQCSFAGVYQPSLMKTFAQSPIVALSFFYDRLEPLGFTSSFTISQLASLAKEVCSDPKLWSTKFPKEKYPHAMELLEDKPELCLDLTFMHGLLSLGYELDGSRTITVAKKLGGTELGWCVGATLALLEESGNICKR